jgi:hypothetical protein
VKFRSKFEKRVWENRGERKLDYEPQKPVISYNTPARYIPDFRLSNGIFIEAKGYFDSRSRGKMLRVKKQNPSLDIRFLFQRANNRITKSTNSMMYWQWAEKHGFLWAEGEMIPEEWYNE